MLFWGPHGTPPARRPPPTKRVGGIARHSENTKRISRNWADGRQERPATGHQSLRVGSCERVELLGISALCRIFPLRLRGQMAADPLAVILGYLGRNVAHWKLGLGPGLVAAVLCWVRNHPLAGE